MRLRKSLRPKFAALASEKILKWIKNEVKSTKDTFKRDWMRSGQVSKSQRCTRAPPNCQRMAKVSNRPQHDKKVLEFDLPDFFYCPNSHHPRKSVHCGPHFPRWHSRRSAHSSLSSLSGEKPFRGGQLVPGLMPNRHGTYIQSTTPWIGYCWFQRSPFWMEIRISALSADQGRWIWLGLQRGLSLTAP